MYHRYGFFLWLFHHQGGDLATWLLGSPGGDMERLRSAVPGLDASCAGKWSKKKPREIRRNLGENLITSHNLSEHLITHKNIQELQDLGVKFGAVTWI